MLLSTGDAGSVETLSGARRGSRRSRRRSRGRARRCRRRCISKMSPSPSRLLENASIDESGDHVGLSSAIPSFSVSWVTPLPSAPDRVDLVCRRRRRSTKAIVVAVGRPGGRPAARLQEPSLAGAVRVHRPDVREAAAPAREGDLRAVRRPRRLGVLARARRQLPQAGAVRVDDVDVEVPVAVARERDPLAVGDQAGFSSQAAPVVIRLRPEPLAAIDRDVEVLAGRVGGGDREPLPVGRPARLDVHAGAARTGGRAARPASRPSTWMRTGPPRSLPNAITGPRRGGARDAAGEREKRSQAGHDGSTPSTLRACGRIPHLPFRTGLTAARRIGDDGIGDE